MDSKRCAGVQRVGDGGDDEDDASSKITSQGITLKL